MIKFDYSYADMAVNDLPGVVERAQRDLADVDFDTLVGTGFSGSIVIPMMAAAMGKNFVLIRKETDSDNHHGPGRLIGNLGERWIFVDDFISSGATRSRVMVKIAHALVEGGRLHPGAETTMVGQYMYALSYHNSNLSSPENIALYFRPPFEGFQQAWIPEELRPVTEPETVATFSLQGAEPIIMPEISKDDIEVKLFSELSGDWETIGCAQQDEPTMGRRQGLVTTAYSPIIIRPIDYPTF